MSADIIQFPQGKIPAASGAPCDATKTMTWPGIAKAADGTWNVQAWTHRIASGILVSTTVLANFPTWEEANDEYEKQLGIAAIRWGADTTPEIRAYAAKRYGLIQDDGDEPPKGAA